MPPVTVEGMVTSPLTVTDAAGGMDAASVELDVTVTVQVLDFAESLLASVTVTRTYCRPVVAPGLKVKTVEALKLKVVQWTLSLLYSQS